VSSESWIEVSVQAEVNVSLLGLSGSLRRASYSTAILQALRDEIHNGVSLAIGDIRLPLYNQDEDGENSPASVQTFREAVAMADGLVIVTPEYNHGMPGVLKNALDWASRPSGRSALANKPVLVISNSPAFTGGVRAQAQVNETLLSISAVILPGKQVVVGGVTQKVQDGKFVDRTNIEFALGAVQRLAGLCRRRGCS
jgi:chromate reductase